MSYLCEIKIISRHSLCAKGYTQDFPVQYIVLSRKLSKLFIDESNLVRFLSMK
jgi:hypothetical protein